MDPRTNYVAIATRRFAEDGFHGASLAAVAKDAGVSKQGLLHFFGTKERLYGEVLRALGERLCHEIEATRSPDPVAHLTAYYSYITDAALSDPQDVKLVMRALLDADPMAQNWPLKPFLDRLTDLVRSLPNASGMSRMTALAEAYRFIGSVQYVAVSLPTVQGIYGAVTRDALAASILRSIEPEVSRISRQ